MTQEDKDLLLKDLCARTPYGVKVNVIYSNENASSFRQRVCVKGNNELNIDIIGLYQHNEIDIKPYLFPLSSMTEEQLYELKEINDFRHNHNTLELVEWTETHTTLEFWLEEVPQYKVIEVFDWLNKNHFDYRGLIEKSLALDATGLNIY